MNYEQEYNRVMSLLQRSTMEHGLCQPRSRRACTACNATDDIKQMVAEYKGARIVLSSPSTTNSINADGDRKESE